jgi:hypothetical protein
LRKLADDLTVRIQELQVRISGCVHSENETVAALWIFQLKARGLIRVLVQEEAAIRRCVGRIELRDLSLLLILLIEMDARLA